MYWIICPSSSEAEPRRSDMTPVSPVGTDRDERRRAWKLQKFLYIHHAQAAGIIWSRTRPVNMFLMTPR